MTFVQDYWQLAFDGPVLTLLSRVTVRGPDGTASSGQPGFRDRLCGCVGRVVAEAALDPHQCLTLAFDDGSGLEVSLDDEDAQGPEAVNFHPDGPGGTTSVL